MRSLVNRPSNIIVFVGLQDNFHPSVVSASRLVFTLRTSRPLSRPIARPLVHLTRLEVPCRREVG